MNLFTRSRFSPSRLMVAAFGALTVLVIGGTTLLAMERVWYAPFPAVLLVICAWLLWDWHRISSLNRELRTTEERTDIILHAVREGVIITSGSGNIITMNQVAEKLTGYRLADARNTALGRVLTVTIEGAEQDLAEIISRCLLEKKVIRLSKSATLIDSMGDEHLIRISAGPVYDAGGRPQSVVITFNDMTESRRALQQIAYHATHDTLTGLPNRSVLIDRLQHAVTQARRSGKTIGVLTINLDFFKKVTDQVGHYGGNNLLKAVGSRLLSCCRDGDTVARIGGDEFVVLLENLRDPKVAAAVADKLLTFLELPFRLDNSEHHITSSIGISVFPQDGNDAETLLQNSAKAVRRSKLSGRNTLSYYSRELNRDLRERMDLEKKLRYAFDHGEFELFYQPQVCLKDGKITRVVALLRWKSPGEGYIAPEKFIPVAKQCGLILPMGHWILETACSQAIAWKQKGLPNITMAVNICSCELFHEDIPDLLGRITAKMRQHRIKIELEIHENMILEDLDQATALFAEFRKLGGRVAIADFGTGSSSLTDLKSLPVDTLKISPSLIRKIDSDQKDKSLTMTVISMAHGLGLKVVAQGVEQYSQVEILRNLRCDMIQGKIFSGPMQAGDITRLLRSAPKVGLLPAITDQLSIDDDNTAFLASVPVLASMDSS